MSSKVGSVSHGSAWVSDCYSRQDDMVGQGMSPGCISALWQFSQWPRSTRVSLGGSTSDRVTPRKGLDEFLMLICTCHDLLCRYIEAFVKSQMADDC